MPLALVTHAERIPQRRFVDIPSPVPSWQLIHREADTLYGELFVVWGTLFTDVRALVDSDALREALTRGSLLDVERLVMTAWQGAVETPARQALPLLIRETVARTAAAALPETTTALQPLVAIQFNVADPSTLAVIDTYVGTQIRGISDNTLRAVRAVIRAGFAEGRGIAAMARQLRTVIGLTPRQVASVEALRQRLLERGVKARQIQREVERAARLALRRRAVVIARTESIYAASAGQHELWRQSDQQGLWDHDRVRRAWLVTPDDRPCTATCRPIPGLNRAGVGLYDPFQTPVGAVLHPPAHAQCRCAVRLKVVGGLANVA